jgi:hypothetical protein
VSVAGYLNGRLVFSCAVDTGELARPPEFPDSLSVVFVDHDVYGMPQVLASATAPIAIR